MESRVCTLEPQKIGRQKAIIFERERGNLNETKTDLLVATEKNWEKGRGGYFFEGKKPKNLKVFLT